MKNYKLAIQYEGTRYNGWQKQGNTKNTIQGKMEDILLKLCGRPVEIHGSGRTDAGVHATAQVANFKADIKLSTEELRDYFNRYLPEDIGVISVEIAEERFHARLSAKSKTYVYRIWKSPVPDVFGRRIRYTLTEKLNTENMRRCAEVMCGTHDFAAFCSNKKRKKSTVRTVYSINIEETENEYIFTFHGNGFLYNMVRIMTGTLVEAGREKLSPAEVSEILEDKKRERAGYTAPPEGLTLEKVEY